MARQRSILEELPKDLLDQYLRWELSSLALSKLTGFHAAAIRRAVVRPARVAKPDNKTALIAARKAYRASLAHMQPKEIVKLAHVSLRTANRIRKLGGGDANK